MAGFANLYVCNGLGQLRDVTLDVRVELFSKSVNPIPGAAERKTLVQRQHFLEHGRGLPVWQMGCPLRLALPSHTWRHLGGPPSRNVAEILDFA
jgi:hypothetical protein